MGLWRGPALAGIDSTALRHTADALEEERLQAMEERFEVELQAGGAGELTAELTELTRQHPYRERLRGALMRALHVAGRTADALAEFRAARDLLRDELGIEPGELLQGVHRAILNHDHGTVTQGRSSPAEGAGQVPRELPMGPLQLVGRGKELAEVVDATAGAGSDRHRPPVVMVCGPGGVGKSALAIRAGARASLLRSGSAPSTDYDCAGARKAGRSGKAQVRGRRGLRAASYAA